MNEGNLNQFTGLFKATEALTNNGKHFIRRQSDESDQEKNKSDRNKINNSQIKNKSHNQ
jgi:hypothetical protein